MPGGLVDVWVLIGVRGSGKTEFAIPIFLKYPSGVWLDLGTASDFFLYKKDNRLGVSILRAENFKDAVAYLSKNVPHYSFKCTTAEAPAFISAFSQAAPGKVLFIDDAQKLLSRYDAVSEYRDFLSDGRMQNQHLIICIHSITEISTKTRREATKLVHIGPLERPADMDTLYKEWIPGQTYENKPDEDVLYRELMKNPQYTAFFLKNK